MPRVLLEVLSLELAAGQHKGAADTSALRSADSAAFAPPRLEGPSVVQDRTPALEAVWTEFRLRVNEHKPLLASIIELATPVALADDGLTIALPPGHKAVEPRLEADQALLDRLLGDVLGRKARLKITHQHKPGPDPLQEKLAKHFGRVEEERPR